MTHSNGALGNVLAKKRHLFSIDQARETKISTPLFSSKIETMPSFKHQKSRALKRKIFLIVSFTAWFTAGVNLNRFLLGDAINLDTVLLDVMHCLLPIIGYQFMAVDRLDNAADQD